MVDNIDEQVHEGDLTYPILRILARAPDGFVETSILITILEALFNPSGKDAEVIEGRGDTYFSQKVRNVISHRESSKNPVAKGWISYDSTAKGLKITTSGRECLAALS